MESGLKVGELYKLSESGDRMWYSKNKGTVKINAPVVLIQAPIQTHPSLGRYTCEVLSPEHGPLVLPNMKLEWLKQIT